MWAVLRNRGVSVVASKSPPPLYSSSSYSYSALPIIEEWKIGFYRGLCSLNQQNNNFNITNNNSNSNSNKKCVEEEVAEVRGELLELEEVEKILVDVRADDVKVIPAKNTCFADLVVLATGRSAWHVRNIAQALIYKIKHKQREAGAKRIMMPSVEGEDGGKWVVVDCGSLIIHALDEKMRAYFNLEALWDKEASTAQDHQDVEKGLVKVRRKNNSKKRPAKSA